MELTIGFESHKRHTLASLLTKNSTSSLTMASQSIKITYFDIKGKAEPIRLSLTIGGIPFEDHRINFADWGEMKPTTRWGQLPQVSIGDVTIAQSNAALRAAGKLTGQYPTDLVEALFVDEILDAIEDTRAPLSRSIMEKDEAAKAAARKLLAEETLPKFFALFEKRVAENVARVGDGGKTYFVGSSLTIADLAFYTLYLHLQSGILDGIPSTVVDGYPGLKGLVEGISARENVAAFEKAFADRKAAEKAAKA